MPIRQLFKIIFTFSLFFSKVHAGKDPSKFDHRYTFYTQVLRNVVVQQGKQTRVNYKKLGKDLIDLNKSLERFSKVKPNEYNHWTDDQKLAFLINVYNAFTLKLVVDNPGIKSLKDLGSIFNPYKAWKIDFIPLFQKKISLDTVEHEMIRKLFNEPRIHFAVNCASISCPPILATPFFPETLDQQLESATKDFLQDKERNYFDMVKNKIFLSKIFKWYGDDFRKSGNTLEKFIAPYLINDKMTQRKIINGEIKIEFLDYNWNLNKTSK